MADNSTGLLAGLKHEIETQIEARLTLLQLGAAEKTARIVSAIAMVLIAGTLLLMVLVFMSLMLAYYFSQLVDSYFLGFAIVAGIYVLLFVLSITVGRRKLNQAIANTIIRMMFDDGNA